MREEVGEGEGRVGRQRRRCDTKGGHVARRVSGRCGRPDTSPRRHLRCSRTEFTEYRTVEMGTKPADKEEDLIEGLGEKREREGERRLGVRYGM